MSPGATIEKKGAMGNKGSSAPHSPLFQDKQFWLSQNVPQRSRFKELIQQHGGIIRLHEKDADIKLVDHARKNLPPDTYSYRYVEWSVKNGQLEDLEKHRAGPSAARPVGATHIPTRSHRLPFTLEDDQHLWDYMADYEKDPNARIQGNRIYQELAAKNPRHTYQSYRDRYLKRLRGRPRPGPMRKPDHPASTAGDSRRESAGLERTPPELDREQYQDDPPAAHITAGRKRKRMPEHSIDHELDGTHLMSQKKRATDKPPKDTTPVPIYTPQTKSPNIQRGLSPANSIINKPLSALDPNTNAPGPVQPQESQSLVHDPDNTIDPLFLELPFLPSSPDPGPEEPIEKDIDAWIDDRLRTGKADNEEQIIEALCCTSMDPYLADKVLDYLVAGKGIPDNMAGVWTAEDDECIEAQESRPIERVLKKHGSESFNSRWEYLRMAKAAGLDGADG